MKLNGKQEILFSCDRARFAAVLQFNDETNEDLRGLSGASVPERGDDPIVGLLDTLSWTFRVQTHKPLGSLIWL
jgi:hypothetical protein